MSTQLGFYVRRLKNESEVEALERTAMEVLRDPGRPLSDRISALQVLRGRKGLSATRLESIAAYKAQLVRLMAHAPNGEVEADGQTFHVKGGQICPRLNFGPRPSDPAT